MSGQDRVTTVVITRDRRAQLLSTLPRHEGPVIVVDNGSTDGTVEAVESTHPQVRVVRAGRNLGAAGRNLGARLAQTPYVAFADDDSWWHEGSLGLAADLMDRHPTLSLLAASVVVEPQGRPDSFNDVLASSPLPGPADVPGVPVLGFMACAAVVRREPFLAVGGFPSWLGVGGEEEVTSWDLAAAGWQLRHVPELLVHHAPQPSSGRGAARTESVHRVALLGALRRRPAGVVLRRMLDAARAGRPGLRALRAAATGLGPALAERRRLPDHLERDLRLLDRS